MSRLRVASLIAFGLAPLLAPASVARAAEVRGVVALSPEATRVQTLGYTRTRVAAPSPLMRAPVGDSAVFLRVKESLPLPAPSAKWGLEFTGLRMSPAVVACAIDESLVITNKDKAPITVVVGSETLEKLAPGASLTYLCQQAGWQKMRVVEWPHVRAELFVGEVGVVALPGPDGKFAMTVPQGTYTLEIVTMGGGRVEVPVVMAGKDVDVGRVGPGVAAEAAAAAAAAAGGGAPPGASPSPSATPTPRAPAPAASAAATPAAPPPAAPASPAPASGPPKPKPKSTPAGGDEINLEP